jgi:hypothetical protein
MKLTLPLSLAVLAVSVASAASSYKVTLLSDLFAGDIQLKAGEYTVTLEGKQAVFKKGKESIQIPAIVEKSEKKFIDTMVELEGSKIHAIDIGGTDIQIMFRSPH